MATERDKLNEIRKAIEEAKGVKESSGLAIVRDTLKGLSRREPTILSLVENFRRSGDGPSQAEAEGLLEVIMSEMARLIDTASGIAERGISTTPTTNPISIPTSSQVTSSGDGQPKHHHHHKHHHHGQKNSTISSSPRSPPPNSPPTTNNEKPVQTVQTNESKEPPPLKPAPKTPAPPPPPPTTPAPTITTATNNNTNNNQNNVVAVSPQLAQMDKMNDETRALMAGPPEIPPEEIDLAEMLGQGAYGKVYRGRVRGKPVAVKVPNRQDLTEHQLKMFRHEVTIMKKIYHTNVVLFLGACMQLGKLMIVVELMSCDLEHLIHDPNRPRLSLRKKLRLANDAALGMNWLHGICNIIHRDLKPANLLLDENLHVKVTDFGFSEVLRGGRSRDMKGPKGTALYMAPEVMRLEEFDFSSDVYSFGLILWELATEIEPFGEYNDLEPFVEAISRKNERPPLDIPNAILLPTSLKSLMARAWDKDPKLRPTFSQVIEELEISIVDATVDEPNPTPVSVFWKSHFMKPLIEDVPWTDFESILARSLGVAPIQLEKLKNSLAKTPSTELKSTRKLVSLENFNLFYRWFGDFFNPPNGTKILREINQLLTAPWFHGDITQEESQARLNQRGENTFLIRLSFKDPKNTPFTISKIKGGVPVHKRIARLSYELDSQARFGVQSGSDEMRSFPTVVALVDKLREEGNLGAPCEKCVIQNAYSEYPAPH